MSPSGVSEPVLASSMSTPTELAHYGLMADLLADVERQPGGRKALDLLFHSAEGYLRMWERTQRKPGRAS